MSGLRVVPIGTESGLTVKIRAEIYGSLAVHRTVLVDIGGRRYRTQTYAVTHRPSGMAMGRNYPTRTAARKAARKFRALAVDWTAVKTHADLKAKTLRQAKTIRAECGATE